jgi:hypothetical protein
MTVYEATMSKIYSLPEPVVREINDFIDFLQTRNDVARWQMWVQFSEGIGLAEGGMTDYLVNLQDYESRLARGEIQW